MNEVRDSSDDTMNTVFDSKEVISMVRDVIQMAGQYIANQIKQIRQLLENTNEGSDIANQSTRDRSS